MGRMSGIETPVLIVGGGPIGLALAADLGRRGVADAAGRAAREQARPRQDARGQRAHHGVLPPARHRRTGAQLGLSARLAARQRVRHRPAGYELGRVRTPSLGVERRLRVQPGAREAVPADLVRSDPAGLRAFVSARHAAASGRARKLRAGRGRRHRDAARSANRPPRPCAPTISSAATGSPAPCASCSASRSAASRTSTGR